jgi:prolyl oligopeptidase
MRHSANISGWLLLSAVLAAAIAADVDAEEGSRYPLARREDTIDAYHGVPVADPYRWLEQLGSAETQEWIGAQNRATRQYLDTLPQRSWFSAKLNSLLDFERRGTPRYRGGHYVYTRNSGTDEQDSVWITDDLTRPGRLLVDPVRFRADGTASLGHIELSPDGQTLAYSVSDGGSDWHIWRLRDVRSGEDLADVLDGTKFTPFAWTKNSRGFYYSRYPQKPDGSYDGTQQPGIRFHRVGSPQSEDVEIFRATDHPLRAAYPQVTEDGRYLIVMLEKGYQTNGVYYLDLATPGSRIVRLLDRWDALYTFLGNRGREFLFQTTAGASTGRIVAIDLSRPGRGYWREVVGASRDAIETASLIAERLVVTYTRDAHARVATFDLRGRLEHELALPGFGTVEGFQGPSDRTETFFLYTDFMTPRTLYRYDVATGEQRELFRPRAAIGSDRYVTEQVFYRSRDGTQVPMYIVHRRGLVKDGSAPTVLYGYGGFNISLLPAYSASRAAWLEAGGVYAVANLRGGGEYGEKWHLAGTRLTKQNVFDDFVAAGEWLVRERYTSSSHLAIWGGSNGGLLIGAVLNQRPDLIAAAVPAVGVMDMLRYQIASAEARGWSSDYGLSSDAEQFRALRAYSPYHNVKSGTCYPATLVIADANDDRVAAWHSYKYAAALQHAQGCDQPTLIRIEMRAGHGFGASRSKIVGEYADQWAFVATATGLKVPGL